MQIRRFSEVLRRPSFIRTFKVKPELHSAPDLTAYQNLGLEPDATFEEIDAAYKFRAKVYHPDKCKHLNAGQIFSDANNSHRILSNAHTRRVYDLCLKAKEDYPFLKLDTRPQTFESQRPLPLYDADNHCLYYGTETTIRFPKWSKVAYDARNILASAALATLIAYELFDLTRNWRYLDDALMVAAEDGTMPAVDAASITTQRIQREELSDCEGRREYVAGFLSTVAVGLSSFPFARSWPMPAVFIGGNALIGALLGKYLFSKALLVTKVEGVDDSVKGEMEQFLAWNMWDFLHGNTLSLFQVAGTLVGAFEFFGSTYSTTRVVPVRALALACVGHFLGRGVGYLLVSPHEAWRENED